MNDLSSVLLAVGGLFTALCSGLAAVITALRSTKREVRSATVEGQAAVAERLTAANDTEAELLLVEEEISQEKHHGGKK